MGKKSNKNKKKSHATLGREKKALFLGSLGGGSLFQGIIAGQTCAVHLKETSVHCGFRLTGRIDRRPESHSALLAKSQVCWQV